MKKTVKRFGMEYAADDAPYAYVEARWDQRDRTWTRVLVTAPYQRQPVIDAVHGFSPTMGNLLSQIGAVGANIHLAPFRDAPSYWFDMSTFHPSIMGARPCGAEVIRYDVLGIQAAEWTATLDGRLRPIMQDFHARLSEVFKPWRPT